MCGVACRVGVINSQQKTLLSINLLHHLSPYRYHTRKASSWPRRGGSRLWSVRQRRYVTVLLFPVGNPKRNKHSGGSITHGVSVPASQRRCALSTSLYFFVRSAGLSGNGPSVTALGPFRTTSLLRKMCVHERHVHPFKFSLFITHCKTPSDTS